MRFLRSALLCVALLVATSAADSVMAPAPSATAPKADLLFILSANTANFSSPTKVTLSDLAYTAQFTGNGKTGIYPVGLFLNSSMGAPFTSTHGQWLSNPQAVLYGSNHGGNTTAVFLTLANPMYDHETNSATFEVAALTAADEAKNSGGAVANAMKDYRNKIGPEVDTTVNADSEYRAVALFIDTNRLALGKTAETKWFGWGGGWGHRWGGWGGGWGGYPYYGGGYYQPYYYNGGYGGGCGCG